MTKKCSQRLSTSNAHATFDVENGSLLLRQVAPGVTLESLQASTGARFTVALDPAKLD